MVEKFNDLMKLTCMRAGIGYRFSGKSSKRKKRTKKWYDTDCKSLSNQLKTLARCIKNDSTNVLLASSISIIKKNSIRNYSTVKNKLSGIVCLK